MPVFSEDPENVNVPARVGQQAALTDVGAAFSQSVLNANFATLVAKINALELVLHNRGITQ